MTRPTIRWPRHAPCAVLAIAIGVVPMPVRAQTAQNASPMSDTTRPHPRMAEARADGVRATLPIGELFVPRAAVDRRRASMPIVVHFHGASWLIEQHVARSAPQAALVTVNLGAGSARYAAPFSDPDAFTRLLEDAADETSRAIGRRVTWSRVVLTSFSAGYGAIRAVISKPDAYARVDAIVLLDSLHASYVLDGDVRAARTTDPDVKVADIDVFTRFAADAAARRTRFVVTHSEVYPGTYASTTDTASALLASLHLTRRPVMRWGPLGMQQLSEARRGGFLLLGFAGNSAPDHVDHLYALGDWLRAWKLVPR